MPACQFFSGVALAIPKRTIASGLIHHQPRYSPRRRNLIVVPGLLLLPWQAHHSNCAVRLLLCGSRHTQPFLAWSNDSRPLSSTSPPCSRKRNDHASTADPEHEKPPFPGLQFRCPRTGGSSGLSRGRGRGKLSGVPSPRPPCKKSASSARPAASSRSTVTSRVWRMQPALITALDHGLDCIRLTACGTMRRCERASP